MEIVWKHLSMGALGWLLIKGLWTRFIPIPYEAVEHCKPLLEFVQDPIQIMNVYKQLVERGMMRSAHVHPESFAS